MTFEQLFNLANIYIVPFWALMIFLPNWQLTKKIIGSYLYFLPLIGLYIYYLAASFEPNSFATLANPTLSNIAAFFSQEGSAGAGWIHFLTMDLFVGRWIYWQGQEKNVWTVHSLVLCLFFGPVGLLSHIITAYFSKQKENSEESEIDTAIS